MEESVEDKRNILADDKPFAYRSIKGNKAQITYRGKVVSVIAGKAYDRLLRAIDAGDAYELQLFLAKATGNFKRGNEKDKR
jgi:hypothetical protein